MNEIKEKISSWQMTTIIIGFLLGSSLTLSFGQVYAGRDSWIAEIISMIIGLITLFMLVYIVKKFPDKGVEEILENLFGKFISRLYILILTVFAIILGVLVINNIASFMTVMVMQKTPLWVFALSMALVTGVTLRYGVEVVARCTEISIPIILFIIVILTILITVEVFDINSLKPLFTTSAIKILKSTIVITSFPYAEAIILMYFFVLVKKEEKLYFKTFLGLTIAGLILTMRSVFSIGVFGLTEANRILYPIYKLVREVSLGEFFQRIELTILVVWFFIFFAKIAVCIYGVAKGLQSLFKLPDYKSLVLPICLLQFPLSLIVYHDFQDSQTFIILTWPLVMMLMFIVLVSIFVRAIFTKAKPS